MTIKVQWQQPIKLGRPPERAAPLFMYEDDLNKITTSAGVYFFARIYDKKLTPLYIGRSTNVRERIYQHLKHKQSAKLMRQIKHESNAGDKILVVGLIQSQAGLKIVEDALIDHVVAQRPAAKRSVKKEHDLFNLQGTKRPVHSIELDGYRAAKNVFGKKITVLKETSPSSAHHITHQHTQHTET